MRNIIYGGSFSILLIFTAAVYAESYYVQLGAYRDPSNANLSSTGSLGQLEQRAGAGGLTRIRIINIESKTAASEVLVQAKEQGFSDAYIGERSSRGNSNKTASNSMSIPAYSGPSDRRISAARDKVSPEQYGNIVYLDGKLVLKEGNEFRPLE